MDRETAPLRVRILNPWLTARAGRVDQGMERRLLSVSGLEIEASVLYFCLKSLPDCPGVHGVGAVHHFGTI